LPSYDPESWNCIDCGLNTGPGLPTRSQIDSLFISSQGKIPSRVSSRCEAYYVHPYVWRAAHMTKNGGCLCIGCLELRLGRRLVPKDFPEHPFNTMPGTERLLDRRGMPEWMRYAFKHQLRGD
jgi:hypothetical protein